MHLARVNAACPAVASGIYSVYRRSQVLPAHRCRATLASMPERERPPCAVEMMARIDRMKRTQAAEMDALRVVRAFNARLSTRRSAGFWPTVATALAAFARHPWLIIACDGCGTVVDLDLRVKPRDPDAAVRVALRDVRCPRCNGHGRPRIAGLSRGPSI